MVINILLNALSREVLAFVISKPIKTSYKKSSACDIPESGRYEVAHDKVVYLHIGPLQHTQRYEKHVGYAVLVAESHETHHGKP
mgnify:FL=1